MKKTTLLTTFLSLVLAVNLTSQVEFGLKMGIHSFDLSDPTDIIFNSDDPQTIRFKDANIGFQGGIYTKINVANVFIEPRIMLNSTTVQYQFSGENGGIFDNIKEETFTNLDIPVLVGFKFLIFDAMLGPVAHLHLNNASDLFDITGYDDRFEAATYGWRAGAGINLLGVDIELLYEGNFSNFGDHINIGGAEFSFDDKPSRLLLNLGFRLF